LSTKVSGEAQWISSLRRQAAGARGRLRLGIGDDCAILRPRLGEEIVVTTDLSLEGVHFRRDWHTPESAGHRCLARGLSDVAAMGARPISAFLSLALPPELAGDWADRFACGLLALAGAHGVPLAGGDTAQAPGASGKALLAADITLLGAVPSGRALLRSGARAGDLIYVTGTLGGAAAELRVLAREPAAFARLRRASGAHPHLFPEPRCSVGPRLLALASAVIDVSDGLSTDLQHLCQESGLSAELDQGALPIAPRADLALALNGGEDYQLLFTTPAARRVPRTIAGVPVTRIGRMLPRRRGAPRMVLIGADGSRSAIEAGGWQHLQ
jgi:thiamine-monophosphate kinase